MVEWYHGVERLRVVLEKTNKPDWYNEVFREGG